MSGESKGQKTNEETDIFDPVDIRSSDDVTRHILEFANNQIREMRSVNTVFQSGGEGLMPEVIRVQRTGLVGFSRSVNDALRRYRLIRAKYPNKKIEIIIFDTNTYKLGQGSINGIQTMKYSHRILTMSTSNYQDLQYLPIDLTNLKIITPEIEVLCEKEYYDVVWKIGDIPPTCFLNCNRLRNVRLNAAVTVIGVEAFAGCTNLSSINLEDTKVQTIHERAFAQTGPIQVTTPSTLMVVLPRAFVASQVSRVTFNSAYHILISEYAFLDCNELLQVHFPEWGKVMIGIRAFMQCRRLYFADITRAVIGIQSQAFYACLQLQNVNIHRGVLAIDATAFPTDTNISRGPGRCDTGVCVLQLRL